MKQLLIGLSAVAILSACGSGDSGSTQTTTAPPPAPAPAPTTTPAADTSTTPAPTPAPPAMDPVIEAQLAALEPPYNEADYSKGRRLFRQCGTCHLVEPDGGNLVGPNLYGLFGREAGALEDYNYSDAVMESGIVWSAEEVDQWLANPRGYLPGNRMSFAGFRKPEDRRDVIAYMMIATAPETDDAAAEVTEPAE